MGYSGFRTGRVKRVVLLLTAAFCMVAAMQKAVPITKRNLVMNGKIFWLVVRNMF